MENYTFDNFRFDSATKQLWYDTRMIPLQPKVAEMLAVFLERNGELINREELMREVWKDIFVEETNLRFCIHSLRKILGKNSGGKDYIETIPRRGYRFTGEVKKLSEIDENTIGRYKILEKIGVGGMGEVFLAHDPQLERKVALKVLLPQVAQDDERIRRFKLEGKAVSALNHPNIVTIFDIGETKENLFIAYEFIEGETVREKIRRNKLTVADSINVAEQVASALSAAHQANIVHRDIKPENIMIRNDGFVKVLDFGLAKRSAFASADDEETLEWVKTQKGIILGSVQYMSPEQSRGVETDERTDIWSLGVVLYEMLTGNNPFEGETISDSVASILHFEPKSINQYLQNFPARLREIIEKSLQTDLVYRYQNINNFIEDLRNVRRRLSNEILTKRIILDNSQEQTVKFQTRITDKKNTFQSNDQLPMQDFSALPAIEVMPVQKSGKWPPRRLLIPVAAVSTAAILFGLYNYLHALYFPNYYARFQNHRVTRLTNDGKSNNAAISDDRQWVALVRQTDGKKDLIIKDIAGGTESKIFSTAAGEILQPTFAPQEKFLLSVRNTNKVYFVKKAENAGTLYSSYPNKGEFSHALQRLPNVDSRISFSPDGKKFAYVRQNEKEKTSSLLISSANFYDNQNLLTERLNSNKTTLTKFLNVAWQNEGEEFTVLGVTEYEDSSGSSEIFETVKRDGRWIQGGSEEVEWTQNGSIFSMGGLGLSISFEPPANYSGLIEIESDLYRFGSFDATADGKTLVVSAKPRYPSLWSFDTASKQNQQILDEYFGIDNNMGSGVAHLPDGRIVFAKKIIENPQEIRIINKDKFTKTPSITSQIHTANQDGTNQVQLTHCERFCLSPVATPDGKFILYEEFGPKRERGLWRINADGTNPIQLTTQTDSEIKITQDSKTVLFQRYDSADSSIKFMRMSVDGGEPISLNLENNSKSPIRDVQIFDDGRSLAFLDSEFDKATATYKRKLKIASLNSDGSTKVILEKDFKGHSFKISPDNKWLVFQNEGGLFRLPLKTNSPDIKPEQLLQTENGWITDFIWLNDGVTILYLLNSEKSDVFLIEDIQ